MNRRERRKQKKLDASRSKGRPLKDGLSQELFQQALGMLQQGNTQGALDNYKQILANNPKHADTLALAGIASCQSGDMPGGIEYLQQSVSIQPKNLDAQFNLGQALEAAERFEEAITPYQKVLAGEPDNTDAHFSLGNIFHALERDEEAAKHLRRVIDVLPSHTDAHSNLGTALKELGQYEEAETAFRQALSLNENNGAVLSNLGSILKELNRLDEAAEIHQRAISIAPDYAEGHGNYANTLSQQGKLDEAIEKFEHALSMRPDLIEVRSNYCMTLLKDGRFEDGWREYSTRWDWKGFDHPIRPFQQPHWQGESLHGKSILVWGEQGIGDELMFASTFSDLLEKSGDVFVECDPRLVPIFQRSFPNIETYARKNPADPALLNANADYQIPSGELCRYLRRDRSAFPDTTCYIKADETETARLRERYKKRGNNAAVIGVSWRSGNQMAGEKRSADLDRWGPILATPGCTFVNLQYGNVKPYLDAFHKATDIEVFCDDEVDPLKNMDLFAAQIAATDLVISIDNSTVHTAGALGVPVWTLLAASPDWRWMHKGAESYWYPSMKLFRQEKHGEWDSVFEAAETALEQFIKQVN